MKKFANIVFAIIFTTYGVTSLIFTPFFLIPYYLFKLVKCNKLASSYLQKVAIFYSWIVLIGWLSKIETIGKKNIPKTGEKFVVFSNHQNIADPIIIQYCITPTIGFVSKKELNRVPLLRSWMKIVKNVMIDRNSPRNSMKAFSTAIDQVKGGYPMAIFPEGTRSGSNKMRAFKKGSFKLALKPDALILPVTIDGSYKLSTGKKFPIAIPFQKIKVTIHKPIAPKSLSKKEFTNIDTYIRSIVNEGLKKPNTSIMPPKAEN